MKYLTDLERRRSSRLFVAAIALLSAFAPMSIDMYLPALPTLTREFATDAAHVQLTLSAFFVGFGLVPLLAGPMLDRFGRRPMLGTATLLYILASLACFLAASIEHFIVLRFLQGIAAGCAPVAVRAIVRDTYQREDAARIMSLTMLIVAAAPMLAPILGGWLLVGFGWRAIFLTLAGFGAVGALVTLLLIPETLAPQYRRPLAWRVTLQGYRQLLGSGPFLRYIMTSGLMFAAMFTYVAGAPFLFINLYGVAPEHFGLIFAINVTGMMIGATLNSRLVRHVGSERMLGFGTSLAAAAGIALLAAVGLADWGIAAVIAPVALMTCGLGMIAPNATALSLQNWPHMAGTASAVSSFTQSAFGALAGGVVGLFHNGTALPMAAIMATCAVLCLLVYRLGPRADAAIPPGPLPRGGADGGAP